MSAKLQRFEESFVYPFSADEEFVIKHGLNGDYFAFFKTLGTPYVYTVTNREKRATPKIKNGKAVIVQQQAGELAGMLCCVLRTLKDRNGQSLRAWYLCDLKVHEKYQGEHIPMKIIKKIAFSRFVQCLRGFAIFMNPADGEPRAASIFKKHGPLENVRVQTLNLYSLSYEEVQKHREALEQALIRHGYMEPGLGMHLGFVTTAGKKDYEIINKNTRQRKPWNLIHMRPTSSRAMKAQEGATHMICAVEGTALDNAYKKIMDAAPSSTAQVMSYGMEDVDFNFLTSDQI